MSLDCGGLAVAAIHKTPRWAEYHDRPSWLHGDTPQSSDSTGHEMPANVLHLHVQKLHLKFSQIIQLMTANSNLG